MKAMKFSVELQSVKDIAPMVREFNLTIPEFSQFDFVPGQFITLMLNIDDKMYRRSYSILNAPDSNNTLRITVSYVDGGAASQLLFNLKPGDKLNALGPVGRLILPSPIEHKRLLLVSTGTGVVPYHAMIPSLLSALDENPNLSVELLFGCRLPKDVLYETAFLKAAEHSRFNYHAFLSRVETEELASHHHKGYVQSGFEALNLDPTNDMVYLCGNPKMIDEAFAWLGEQGFGIASVRREKYISSPAL